MKYVKKKLNILLLLLLVALFTSLLGTTCYAYEVTYDDCEKIALYYYNQSDKTTDLINKMWTAVDNIQTSTQSLNAGIDTVVISCEKANYYIINIYGLKSSEVTAINNPNDINYMNVTTNRHSRIYYSLTSYGNATTWTSSRNQSAQSSLSFGSGSQLRTDYLFISNTLGNDLFTGPWQNKTILDLNDDYFIYAKSSLIDEIDLNGSYYFSDTAQIINFVRDMSGDVNEADAVIPGYIALAKNFDYAEFDSWSYNVTTGMYEPTGETWKQTTLGTIESDIIDVTFSALNWGSLYKADTIIHAEFVPKSNEYQNQHAYYYIYSQFTQVNNGVLDTKNTFSGDYALIVNSNNNTDKIINNDNSLYDKMFKISGDKIDNIFQEAMEKIEIESGELAEYEIIKHYLEGEPRRFYNIVGFIYAKPHDKRKSRGIW